MPIQTHSPLQTDPEHDFRKKRTIFPPFPSSRAQTLPPFPRPLPPSQCVFQRATLRERTIKHRRKGKEREREEWMDGLMDRRKEGRGQRFTPSSLGC